MTTVEAARVGTAKAFSERTLITALDSILADYYAPLFQNYHIFALDGGYGTDEMQEDEIIDKLEEYMDYTFNPTNNLKLLDYQLNLDNFNPFEIGISSLKLNKVNSLLDYNGKLFSSQEEAYMKYKEVGNGLDSFLNKTSVMKETKQAQTVLKEKTKTEETIYKMDKSILKLMMLIDGISVNGAGINIHSDGSIEIEDYFVKKIYTGSGQMDAGINNQMVSASLQNHYIQTDEQIDLIIQSINLLIENKVRKDNANTNLLSLLHTDTSKIKDKKELKEYEQSLQSAREELQYCIEMEENLITTITDSINMLKNLFQEVNSRIQSAFSVIDGLIIEQNAASIKIDQYKSLLTEYKDSLNEEFYKNLLSDLEFMEQYRKMGEEDHGNLESYNFQGMKDTLINNQAVLKEVNSYLDIAIVPEESQLNVSIESLLQVKNKLKQYSLNNLVFDYSTLTVPVESKGFFDGITNLMNEGIMGLLVEDNASVSKKSMTATDLPSSVFQMAINSKTKELDSISNINLNSGGNALVDIISGFDEELGFVENVTKGGDALAKMILLQEYFLQHFKNYSSKNNPAASQTVLDYEVEYILSENNNDYDNLTDIAMRILLIRVIMNVITIMGDGEKSNEARLLAAGFVGFSGLPALVGIAKTIIIIAWAFAESIVDVAAMLKGKTVPFLKSGGDIQLKLNELFIISRALIQKKADNIKSTKAPLETGYLDYLRIFLFVSQSDVFNYRAMDLIQENLQMNYDDNFYIKNCIFGFQADAEFQMQTKFITLPFVEQILKVKDGEYRFRSIKEYSY
jgi:hypothetical protein